MMGVVVARMMRDDGCGDGRDAVCGCMLSVLMGVEVAGTRDDGCGDDRNY